MVESSVPSDILDDLSSRFIINVPEEERKDLIRICFQIELAHWFYLDFYCTEENPKLRRCNMKEFATHIFSHIPFLKIHVGNIDNILEQWREYKQSVPTFGAIVLNEDLTQVLLVQSYWSKNSWSFPKGKVNKDEPPSHCAVREVLEETGFDISSLIDEDAYIESTINDQLVRLYIISGVKKDTKFQPKTRKEIKSVEWFALADLPNYKRDMTPKVKIGFVPSAFFMVVPFVKRMKRWIQEKQQRERHASTIRRHRHKSLGDVESVSKTKRQQQVLPDMVQNDMPDMDDFKDLKNLRQSMTSPARTWHTPYDGKAAVSKAGIKRNLFGEPNEDRSSPVLAKQLTDSPQTQQSCSFLIDPAIQSVKCNDLHYKARSYEGDVKGKTYKRQDYKNLDTSEGNIKSLLFGEAARRLQTDLKNMSPPFTATNRTASQSYARVHDYRSQLAPTIWSHFAFDKQAILNCL
ncbi:hypothetical protein KM043_006070 [Ampulex compressa]|nr:hypothetical protein KM043_006070 [Ampulex compressa]